MLLGWALLRRETRLWQRLGHRPVLWWRDDDARHDTPSLDRLLTLSRRYRCPLTIAVIPAGSHEGLRTRLGRHPQVAIAQHGVTHTNLQPPHTACDEFRPGTAPDAIAASIRSGADRLQRHFDHPVALFVPAWNRMSPELIEGIARTDIPCISGRGGMRQTGRELDRLDVHLDLLRWRGGPRFRGEERFLRNVRQALRLRRRAGLWTEPLGLLTHHLDHDEGAWRFLEQFLRTTTGEALFDWTCVTRLLPRCLGDRERSGVLGAAQSASVVLALCGL